MRLFRSVLTLALVAGGMFATAGRSEAAFSITFTQTGGSAPGPVTITDGGVGDNDATVNVIGATTFTFGDYRITLGFHSITGAHGVEFLPSATNPQVFVNSLAITRTAAPSIGTPPTLQITITASGVAIPAGYLTAGLVTATNNAGVVTSATATSAASTTTLPLTGGGSRSSTTLSGPATSLTLQLNLANLPQGAGPVPAVNFQDSSADLSPPQVPAPATLIAAIGCLPVLSFVGALRRRKVKEAAAV